MIRDSEKKWRWLTGNQIGVLILDYILSNLSKKIINKISLNITDVSFNYRTEYILPS